MWHRPSVVLRIRWAAHKAMEIEDRGLRGLRASVENKPCSLWAQALFTVAGRPNCFPFARARARLPQVHSLRIPFRTRRIAVFCNLWIDRHRGGPRPGRLVWWQMARRHAHVSWIRLLRPAHFRSSSFRNRTGRCDKDHGWREGPPLTVLCESFDLLVGPSPSG